MKQITIFSYAKINLSIDVKNKRPDGNHEVDMIMDTLEFHDDVTIAFKEAAGFDETRGSDMINSNSLNDTSIKLTTNKHFLPTDERNIAYKAAKAILETSECKDVRGQIFIDIKKRIPIAAGLAGGSGNAAAVLLGLNEILNLNLELKELCNIGKRLGADVPFCILAQAKECPTLAKSSISKDALATTCARATGIGAEIENIPSVKFPVVIAKPHLSVSTKEVYEGIDDCKIDSRPDNDRLVHSILDSDTPLALDEMINVLECFTLNKYERVRDLKKAMLQCGDCKKVMMSGSGPTVFAVFYNYKSAKKLSSYLREQGYEAYWTKTI